ncbi:nematode fatty acid retinoid binding protein [Teladorsagia circumcincta]|uniref:Fatty-acid and retinol-binding protein 1 n=1 Tax=Teladorsagia circumcincta TaxID=45464 RepID=A0A2G9UHM8_TELCI|nr:nematode fatty acid retinoid binding protein [Teladorsagia circumcincta]
MAVTKFSNEVTRHKESADDTGSERNILPSAVRSFLNGLSETDKATLKEAAMKFQNEQQAIDFVKAKSPQLGAQVEKFYEMGKKKINALTPEARSFVDNLYHGVRKMYTDAIAGHKPTAAQLKEKSQEMINKYDALSSAAKADLQKEFPTLSTLLKSGGAQESLDDFWPIDKDLPNKLANIHIAN